MSLQFSEYIEIDVDVEDVIRQLDYLSSREFDALKDALLEYEKTENQKQKERALPSLPDKLVYDRMLELLPNLTLDDVDEIEERYGKPPHKRRS